MHILSSVGQVDVVRTVYVSYQTLNFFALARAYKVVKIFLVRNSNEIVF